MTEPAEASSGTSSGTIPSADGPARAPRDGRSVPLVTVLILAAVIVIAGLGVGYGEGWFTRSRASSPYAHPATCASPLDRFTWAATNATAPFLSAESYAFGVVFANLSGNCVSVNSTVSSDPYAALGDGTISFALTSSLPSPSVNASFPRPVVFLPLLVDAVAVVYNLPAGASQLNLTPAALSGILLGTTTRWNASSIASANPGTSLSGFPPITVLRSSATSDLSRALAGYLSVTNATWNASVGSAGTVPWPTGSTASNDSETLADVAATPGAIGYVQATSLGNTSLGVARLENAAGRFVPPNATDAGLAASVLASEPAFDRTIWPAASVLDAPGNDSYPAPLVAYAVLESRLNATTPGALSAPEEYWLLTYLDWAADSAQELTSNWGGFPMPTTLTNIALAAAQAVTYNGASLLVGPPGVDDDGD